jgi:hypothetical protein
LVECPVGIIILIVPHVVEVTKEVRHRDNWSLGEDWKLELMGKLCLGDLRGRTNVTDCGGRKRPLTKWRSLAVLQSAVGA